MEHSLTTLGNKVDSLEVRVISIEQKLDKLIEGFSAFSIYVKDKFGQHEKLLESISTAIFRIEERQTRLEGMVQGLYFRDFQN